MCIEIVVLHPLRIIPESIQKLAGLVELINVFDEFTENRLTVGDEEIE